jgi:hypothetical protein
MIKPQGEKKEQKKQFSGRLLGAMSRFIVSLTWGILLAVVIFVVYIIAHQ